MKLGILFLCSLVTLAVSAQELTVPQLVTMLDWPDKRIDTTIKKKGYVLMQKDIDSASRLFQYSHLDRKDESVATVRSFSYMDVALKQVKSRLIKYRTYSKEEYQQIAAWLLANNYHTTDQYDFKDEKHTLFSNGQQAVRIKVQTTILKNKKSFTAYELEIGK
jgi:hypothetical protein